MGGHTLKRSQSLFIYFFCAAVFLVFFRAPHAFTIYSHSDDACYFRHLTDFLGIKYDGCDFPVNFYAKGAAIGWLPAGIIGKILSTISGADAVDLITPLVGLSAFAMWCACLILLSRLVPRLMPNNRWPEMTAAVVLLNFPLLYYVTNRTTMAHPFECLTATAFIYFLFRDRWGSAILLAGLTVLTRYNDLPILGLLVGRALDRGMLVHLFDRKSRSGKGTLVAVIAGGAALAVLYKAIRVAFIDGYGGWTLVALLKLINPHELWRVVGGGDWGLLFTGLPWFALLILGFFFIPSLSWTGRFAWLWMLGCYLLAAANLGPGSDFGQRYLLGTYPAALVVFADLLRRRPVFWRPFKFLSIATAVWLLVLTWLYKTQPELSLFESSTGYINPDMQKNAARALFHLGGLIRPAGLSPLVTLALSFLNIGAFEKYRVHGFALGVLSLASGLALSVPLLRVRRK